MQIDQIKTATDLGVAIKRIRKHLGLSQSDLSKRINMRQPTISDVENGKGTLDSAFKIIQAMGLNLSLGDSGNAKRRNSKVSELMDLIKD